MSKRFFQILGALASFFVVLMGLLVCSNSFAFPGADDSQQQSRVLHISIKSFFGDLRGTFRLYDSKLSDQIGDGLENNQLSDRKVFQLPRVGKSLYFDSGSTERDFPLFAAVVITSSEKVVSAAMLDSAGLTIFLRPSSENGLFVVTFKKWAQDVWCSKSPEYVGLGYATKLNQNIALSVCRPLPTQTIYLSGYGNRSVN